MPRLFFALQPGPSQRQAMHEATLPLVRETGGRPVHPEDLHLTLCFLGEVPGQQVATLIAAGDRVRPLAARIAFDRMDFWRRSRVLCLLPRRDEAAGAVEDLAAGLRNAATGAGFTPDARPFIAHVTIARKVSPAKAGNHAWPLALTAPLDFASGGFALLSSTGGGDEPRYKVVHAWDGPPPLPSPARGS